jgi:hypothetical protein
VAYELPQLPHVYDVLEPTIDEQTVHLLTKNVTTPTGRRRGSTEG